MDRGGAGSRTEVQGSVTAMPAATTRRTWVLVDRSGEGKVLELDKHGIMRRVPIHARDLRILDPLLSYPSAILSRERAIVLNLEHIKAIVTTDEVLLRDPLDDNVVPIVNELQRRLPVVNAISQGQAEDEEPSGVWNDLNPGEQNEEFPFEFRALEVALEGICSFFDELTSELEAATYPALDELVSKISGLNLDRVRKLKSSMTRLTNRVQKVRDELEQLLDDDGDMADLCLSRKLALSSSPTSSRGMLAWSPASPVVDMKITRKSGTSRATCHNDIEEVEMLLEAYFIQVEGTMNRLNTLQEYIDDTEDYINIQLDNHRNQLIQLQLFLCSGAVSLSVYSLVAAAFGMNIPHPWKQNHGYIFKWVVILTGLICGSIFFLIMTYARCKGLLSS